MVDLDNAGTAPNPVADLDQDFGYAPFGHTLGDGLIGDTIFLDRDNSGTPDAGEGIQGVTVELRNGAAPPCWRQRSRTQTATTASAP